MDTIFMYSKSSEISDTHRLLRNLIDKINLKRRDKYIANIYYRWKNLRK